MSTRNTIWLVVIAAIFIFAGTIAWPGNGRLINPFDQSTLRDIPVRQGLDLQGGLQVLLEADDCSTATADAMATTRTIIENRVNAFGVNESVVQQAGTCRLVVELPGVTDTSQALTQLRQTALLEFVDTGTTSLPPGTEVQTDHSAGGATPATNGGDTAEPTPPPGGTVYHTVMTGEMLVDAQAGGDQLGNYLVNFELTDEGGQLFSQFTSTHVNQYLTIVLDKKVISSPVINSTIGKEGQISGEFTYDEANALAINLRYGALPVSLHIAESRTVGATLGEDSVRKSIIAGAIGLATVAVFMMLYYRLPGVLAVAALLMYATITFAIFKLWPVTLTLPGIAGFVLSVGVAVDANVLIFERMKEELRAGKRLILAVEEGFRRAWPSIRDSNISTMITCLILFGFGSQFGASIVKGFALTLALGVIVSLFTAILVTRSLLHAVLDNIDFTERHSWFGI